MLWRREQAVLSLKPLVHNLLVGWIIRCSPLFIALLGDQGFLDSLSEALEAEPDAYLEEAIEMERLTLILVSCVVP